MLFALLAVLAASPSIQAQQVYVGAADQWGDLLAHPDQWQYVRQNADGFYVNFIEMGWVVKNQNGMNSDKLKATATLFEHKNAYLESDMMSASLADDQSYITQLQAAGFTIPYTSLNYGWSAPRAANLKTYALPTGQAPRPNLVQQGPWAIGGTILGDHGGAPPLTNADYRSWITQADGASTDGPLGFWLTDQGGMRRGSYSMVQFAHSLHKKAMVMLCPYGAGQASYNPGMFLQVAKDCVHQHEDAGALPDIWSVFEYATTIPAVPEAENGQPFNSTTGVAYWLLYHLHDPQRWARLDAVTTTSARQTGPTRTFTYRLHNDSPWLDLCPLIRAKLTDPGNGWSVHCTLDGQDVTDGIMKDGVACVGAHRLLPQKEQILQITLTQLAHTAATHRTASLLLELAPHPSLMGEVHQRILIPLR